MSGYLRSTSAMGVSQDTPQRRAPGRRSHQPDPSTPGDTAHGVLKVFGLAKRKIAETFARMEEYTRETKTFLEEEGVPCQLSDDKQVTQVLESHDKAVGIIDVLQRDHMKVAFFGRTSNGKSTVINAMLKRKILPSGIGHTTNCFLQIQGTDQDTPYILIEGSEERLSVESVEKLAHALCIDKLGESSLVKVFWPSQQCNLLKDDVVLVDSPGIDVSPDLDSWIDKHCLDADVFVLVANAESTLMQAEKNFFHKVSLRLSKPNVFVLNNRWDASAQEPETMEQVKQQHLERNVNFLSEELKVVEKGDVKDRVFFVSAREALASRTPKGTPGTPQGPPAEGYHVRLMEFEEFEKKFAVCLSNSAVQTKFQQHALQGKKLSGDLYALMDSVLKLAHSKRQQVEKDKNEKRDYLDFIHQQLELVSRDIKDNIVSLVDEVHRQVAQSLSEEIRKLPVLVDQYEQPFHTEPIVLNAYKKELNAHVEKGLGKNLTMKCSGSLEANVESCRQEMTDRLSQLLSSELTLPPRDFHLNYLIDCPSLCQDFEEDVEFRFSYGITSLMRRFLGPRYSQKLTAMGYTTKDRQASPLPLTPQVPSNPKVVGGYDVGGSGDAGMSGGGGRSMAPAAALDDNELMVALMSQAASLTSRTTLAVLIVSGVMWRAVGWKVLGVTVGAYGLLYLYERLTYTNRAKERKFKQQYVDHVTHKLKLVVDLTSSNCSHQIQQELTGSFASLCHLVDQCKQEVKVELERLDTQLAQLEQGEKSSRALRNKADFLSTEFDSFIQQYLKNA